MVTQYNADWFRSYSRKLSTWTRVTTIVPKFTTLRNIRDNLQNVSMDKHLIWLAQTKMQLWTSEVAGIRSRVGARVIPQCAILELQDWFIRFQGNTSYKQPWWQLLWRKASQLWEIIWSLPCCNQPRHPQSPRPQDARRWCAHREQPTTSRRLTVRSNSPGLSVPAGRGTPPGHAAGGTCMHWA